MCLKNCGWTSIILYSRQRTELSQRKRKANVQSSYLRGVYKELKKKSVKQGRKGKAYPTKHRFPKNNTERQEGLLQGAAHKTRGRQKGKD